jgi:hypothetical protein
MPAIFRKGPFLNRASAIGTVMFLLVPIGQLPFTVYGAYIIARDPVGAAHNAEQNIRTILSGHPDLQQSVIIADPDFLVEALPYYVSNPTYLMREHRYGKVVQFIQKAQLELSLADVLANARMLRQETGRPVVILLAEQIDPAAPALRRTEGYNWAFTITPDQAREFQAATRLIGHRPPAETTEEYYVYVLD